MEYNTGIKYAPPVTPQMRDAALAGLSAYPGFAPGPAADVYAAEAQRGRTQLDRQATALNNEYSLQAQEQQRQAMLKGAQVLSNLKQNQQNLDNQKQQMALDYSQKMMGNVNGLLQGLFR
jgi:hypothetical protein